MGVGAFPPVGPDTWNEVATATVTSGSSVTLSGIPARSKLRIVGVNVTSTSTSSIFQLTVNNDTTSSYFYTYDVTGVPTDTSIPVAAFCSSMSFDLTFTAADQPIYKTASGFAPASGGGSADPRNSFNATWANTAVINRFDLTLSTGTFTAGTIKVFAA
jgi:hypothetical protein